VTSLDNCYSHFQAESYKVASEECKIAANEGNVDAQWLLAQIYRHGLLDGDSDLKDAFFWYQMAADEGHVESMREVGLAYLYGEGKDENFELAYQWLKKAANKQDTTAEFSIGILFFEGKGKKKDIGSAINWFKRAAVKKHVMSINNLAWIFATS
jgi:TPR repeat protein